MAEEQTTAEQEEIPPKCPDGTPHDYEPEPYFDDKGREVGHSYTCKKCGQFAPFL